MPRFHFNIYDGVGTLDRDGTELPDGQAARFEAIRLAGAVLRDDAQRIALDREWRMEVTDAAGLILFRLDFSVVDAVPDAEGHSPGDPGSPSRQPAKSGRPDRQP